jgi:hypothetical protein
MAGVGCKDAKGDFQFEILAPWPAVAPVAARQAALREQ